MASWLSSNGYSSVEGVFFSDLEKSASEYVADVTAYIDKFAEMYSALF